jgi:hypothetical protein
MVTGIGTVIIPAEIAVLNGMSDALSTNTLKDIQKTSFLTKLLNYVTLLVFWINEDYPAKCTKNKCPSYRRATFEQIKFLNRKDCDNY